VVATPGDIGALVHNFGNARWKRCNERLCDHYRFDLPASIAVRANCAAASRVLAGQRCGFRPYLALVGPAVVASIAYMDPGVVLLANVIAMLFPALSAKLGIVTGRNLAEMCREEFPQPVASAMWIISEVAAMAIDLAEFLGGAIGFSLLFGIEVMVAFAIAGMGQYRDGDNGVGRLPRGTSRRGGYRDCLSYLDAASRHCGIRRVLGLPNCVWHVEFLARAALSHRLTPRRTRETVRPRSSSQVQS
jgi:hypothetical protein